MKSDLMLNKFDKIPVAGTNSVKEFRNYFGSKMVEIEDSIIIDDISIQYSEIQEDGNNNGFQDYVVNNMEIIKIINLTDMKKLYSSIELLPQSSVDLENNTRWVIKINAKKILQEYLFLKLKENRTFKCVYYKDLYGYDVNTFIRYYIDENILNRYKFDRVDLYVNYINVATYNDVFGDVSLKYNPIMNKNIAVSDNLVKNVNLQQISNIIYLDELKIAYNQIKKSTEYKFDYYFNIHYTKI